MFGSSLKKHTFLDGQISRKNSLNRKQGKQLVDAPIFEFVPVIVKKKSHIA